MKSISTPNEKEKDKKIFKSGNRNSAGSLNNNPMNCLSGKSKSTSKFTIQIDKDEILKEFSEYKNTRSTQKLLSNDGSDLSRSKLNSMNASIKNSNSRTNNHFHQNNNLERSISNTSKGKFSKGSGSNLIPIRSVKVKEKKDGKRTLNASQNDNNRSYYGKSTERKIARTNFNGELENSDLIAENNKISNKNVKISNSRIRPNLVLEGINTNYKVSGGSKSRVRNNVDIYNLYKICCSNSTENTHNELFSTLEKDTGSNINSGIGETGPGLGSKSGSGTIHIPGGKSNENYEKYCQHLVDQITYLNYKIKEYKSEKEKLLQKLDESKTDERYCYIDKLEKEIKSYKHMTESCVKTCSQLAEEVMTLRKEIDKYTTQSMGLSYSSSFAGFTTKDKERSPRVVSSNKGKSSSAKKITSVSPLKKDKGRINKLI